MRFLIRTKNTSIATKFGSSGNAVAFGVSGANIVSPFNGDAIINTGSGTRATASKTTTNINDFIIDVLGAKQSFNQSNVSEHLCPIATLVSGTKRDTSDQHRIVSGTGHTR